MSPRAAVWTTTGSAVGGAFAPRAIIGRPVDRCRQTSSARSTITMRITYTHRFQADFRAGFSSVGGVVI